MTDTRFLVRRSATGVWLDTDLDATVRNRRRELNGSGSFTVTCSPDLGQLRADDGLLVLEPFASTVYIERSGRLRQAGIVTAAGLVGDQWTATCEGVSAYPYGIPYMDTLTGVDLDPADIVRNIWAHLQSYPNAAALGMQVIGATTARVGTEKETTGVSTVTSGPYELVWWDSNDCGREIDQLAKEAPFEWVEGVAWVDKAQGTVKHFIDIRAQHGTRREDLRFEQGVNITTAVQPEFDEAAWANEVLVLGAGEGGGSIRSTAAVQDGRLRRPVVIEAKDIRSTERATTRASTELSLRSRSEYTVQAITVLDHPNAPLESWQIGDQVPVSADLPFLGRVDRWMRIVAHEIDDSESDGGPTAVIELDPTGG